jgi:hypothetical protein
MFLVGPVKQVGDTVGQQEPVQSAGLTCDATSAAF